MCIYLLFSVQIHGAGKWRERIYRFLPFIAPKAYKLEKREKARLEKRMTSLSDRELVVLDLELSGQAGDIGDIGTIEKMARATKQEIYRRISVDGQSEILEMLAPTLTARLDNILSDEKTAPQFFEIFQNATRGNPPKEYKNILKEFFFAHTEKIMALEPTQKQFGEIGKVIFSADASIRTLQEVLYRGKSTDAFLRPSTLSPPIIPNLIQKT